MHDIFKFVQLYFARLLNKNKQNMQINAQFIFYKGIQNKVLNILLISTNDHCKSQFIMLGS